MMDINFKKYITFSLTAFVVSSILFASNARADEVFANLTTTGWALFGGMRQIIFAAAAFGIIAIAIGGLFGAFNWKWLSAIIIGVVVIALTVGLVQYLTAGTGADVTVTAISDSLISGS